MSSRSSNPILVACPFCGAAAGVSCGTVKNREKAYAHQERRALALKTARKARIAEAHAAAVARDGKDRGPAR